jgi:SAM-dependent methyltransferase
MKVLSLFDLEASNVGQRFAVDLGCGAGRDTFELLRRGWQVLAVDNHVSALAFVRSNVPLKHRTRLKTRLSSFETVRLPTCDLINGSYSLPFCRPECFDAFWRRVLASLRSGGRLAGHLFGIHDEWASSTDMTFHTALQVKILLSEMETEFLEEKEWKGTTASGKRKHWHVFSIVARKPA